MWAAKITFDGSNALIGSRTLKHKVNLFAFPLSYFYERNHIVVNITGNLLGKEKNKRDFVRDFKKADRLVNLEFNEDFFIGTIKEPTFAKTLYNKDIIHLSPALIDENGQEILNIACFKKEKLAKAINTLEKTYEAKINYIEERKIKNISIIKQNPELTNKQKQAMSLAIKNGYYNYPRKIDIQQLAKLSKLSFSTFHAHLRKAEQKLLPFYFKKQ
ncbi:MAG: helix-turn-helix domain-containing protein [Candidatus Nanoarchaeia archaeon]|nr:helix-turn-helix domain-containing protein [Candidatus Nanoarchaeia archaeon]MDD5740786.1 helix-turn-helix domain-containing protein [Candidatus Nanoarchaeia archaeon]